MALAKRVVLFLLLNLMVVGTISFLMYIFNVQPFLRSHGLDYRQLAIFCLLWGFGGAFISLMLSRIMAKWMMGITLVDPRTRDPELAELVRTVYHLAEKASLTTMPEVGVYDSPELNAFATGPSRSRSLVAVSTGLLRSMRKDEVAAVLGHEIAHISNGDMVTMTLLQGVINAFVMFFARIVAFFITQAFGRKDDSEESSQGTSSIFYYVTVMVLEVCFMLLGAMVVAAFSRYREFRADAGGARLAGRQNMINALIALKRNSGIRDETHQQEALQAFKISNPAGLMRFFATHPPLEKRIERLQSNS